MLDTLPQGKRSEPRIASQVAVFVETYSAPSSEAVSTNIVISKTLDVSANGLQVVMDSPLHIGSILQLCIEFTQDHQRYHLVGEVRWVSRTRFEKHFLVGFMLLDAGQSHIEDWKQKVAIMMGDPDAQVH